MFDIVKFVKKIQPVMDRQEKDRLLAFVDDMEAKCPDGGLAKIEVNGISSWNLEQKQIGFWAAPAEVLPLISKERKRIIKLIAAAAKYSPSKHGRLTGHGRAHFTDKEKP